MRIAIIVLSLCLLSGCKIKEDLPVITPGPSASSAPAVDRDVQAIADSMSEVTKKDAELMYIQFSGLVAYLGRTEKITTMKQFNGLFERFQTDYGYTREKYPEYSDAVEKFLIKRGYEKYQTITEGRTKGTALSRQQLIADMQVLADAAKMTLDNYQK